jgi:hypothetical protein
VDCPCIETDFEETEWYKKFKTQIEANKDYKPSEDTDDGKKQARLQNIMNTCAEECPDVTCVDSIDKLTDGVFAAAEKVVDAALDTAGKAMDFGFDTILKTLSKFMTPILIVLVLFLFYWALK